MFLIPGITSVLLFGVLWWTDLLPRPQVVGGCVLVGVAAQSLAPAYSVIWVTGLLLNVGTAIYLTIQVKLSW